MKLPWLCMTLIALFFLLPVTESGADTFGSTGRSFALFSVSYNRAGQAAQGGVCGTVFFVSESEAITAYHVINDQSFKPLPGYERKRLWLVHEDEAPIEVRPEYLTSDRERDLTRIRLPIKVARRFVFDQGTAEINAPVTSEGFIANSTGPILERRGEDLHIATVPRLQRVFARGILLRKAAVDLKASDLELKNSPSLDLSFEPVQGMSGGPVLANGKVIAMNSFADPRSFKRTWALELAP